MRMQRAAAGLTALVLATGAGGHAAGSGDDRAREVLAAARKAIGGGKLDALATLSVQAGVQRNAGNFQLNSDVEMLLEMPDKYARMDSIRTPMVAEMRTGFNGDRALQGPGQTAIMGGGAMMIRMGPGAAAHSGKLTPEQQAEANRTVVLTARHELSRLLLGWFGMAHPSLSADYKYYGEAESPDGRADVIEVSGADGFAARLFIDQQTHLPLMVTYQASRPRVMTVGGGSGSDVQVMRRSSGQASDEDRKKIEEEMAKRVEEMRRQPPEMAEYSLFFSEWQKVDGVMFPHRITRAMAGTPTEEWTISKVKVNPKIDAKKFAIEG